MLDFGNYSTNSKCYDDLNALVVGEIENEVGSVAIEFLELKPKIYSILLSDSSEYKKAKGVNKRVAAKASHD